MQYLTGLAAAHCTAGRAQQPIWHYTDVCFRKCWIFWGLLALRDLRGADLHSCGLTDRQVLVAVRWSMGVSAVLHPIACLCVPVCPYRFLWWICCINNIMLFCQASLSLGHFVQPSLSLLSTITVCNRIWSKGIFVMQ